MELLRKSKKFSEVRLSIEDLSIIHQSFNEICNGIRIPDFENIIGAKKYEVLNLMKKIDDIVYKIEKSNKKNNG